VLAAEPAESRRVPGASPTALATVGDDSELDESIDALAGM